MPSERSYEDKRPGQQLYGVIEFCASPKVLYAKIESGHYDWLGVRQDKRGRVTYVVGRPRLARLEGLGGGIAKHGPPSMTGQHHVEVRIPHRLRPPPSESWWLTSEEARADFERKKVTLMQGDGSGLYRLRLYSDGRLVDEHFVVRTLPNVL
ncbi:hypothetical protein [Blastococcus saxobsidens]|uniref:Uncharacterized protein n=1 Tax=Blastococcus saxobsidens (strain DD2) TaxID=1146883 RepID=H6RRX8_BLASD|nr:hypothetical protein [Blastococcus saxobsidens]CCG02972.1 protein of unknown function [Blastococcus saxobsidens DD2]